jgi:hypothetical protein
MFEAKSAEIRRFFDLLGSIVVSLIGSFAIWQDEFRFTNHFTQNQKYLFQLLFMTAVLSVYLIFHRLIWRFVNTRFLYGYANFLLISILSVSSFVVLIIAVNLLLQPNFNQSLFLLNRLLSRNNPFEIIVFYWATSLPMAFFWLIGILTSWRFSEKNTLR